MMENVACQCSSCCILRWNDFDYHHWYTRKIIVMYCESFVCQQEWPSTDCCETISAQHFVGESSIKWISLMARTRGSAAAPPVKQRRVHLHDRSPPCLLLARKPWHGDLVLFRTPKLGPFVIIYYKKPLGPDGISIKKVELSSCGRLWRYSCLIVWQQICEHICLYYVRMLAHVRLHTCRNACLRARKCEHVCMHDVYRWKSTASYAHLDLSTKEWMWGTQCRETSPCGAGVWSWISHLVTSINHALCLIDHH